MSDKEYSGNFYRQDQKEELPDDCPNCLYPNKKVEKQPDDCPNCLYRPQKNGDK